MAVEADCGVSTVLERSAWRAQSGSSYLWGLAALETRPSATTPRRPGLPGEGFKLRDAKFEIRNSKFEILRQRTEIPGSSSLTWPQRCRQHLVDVFDEDEPELAAG